MHGEVDRVVLLDEGAQGLFLKDSVSVIELFEKLSELLLCRPHSKHDLLSDALHQIHLAFIDRQQLVIMGH